MPSQDLPDFERFLQERADAARAYICGDAAPLGGLVAKAGDATFFAPRGGAVHDADEVWSTYEHDAASFAPGGDSHFEILQMGASDGIAYWVGFQKATVHMHGHSEPVPFNLRVTEVFRREGDAWKMIHRHADALAEAEK